MKRLAACKGTNPLPDGVGESLLIGPVLPDRNRPDNQACNPALSVRDPKRHPETLATTLKPIRDHNEVSRTRTAIVTGGSSGLGLVIAAELLAAGYRVVILGRDRQRIDSARVQIMDRSRHRRSSEVHESSLLSRTVDVTDEEAVRSCFEELESAVGVIDVLVNCVGRSDRGRTENLTPDRLRALIDVNVTSALLCSQAALPMLKRSHGVVVNIGSLAGRFGTRYLGGYCAAKHALAGLTQQMRLEWIEYGVHVGLVSPGPILREEVTPRYETGGESLPESASRPAGGAAISGLDPLRVARAVISCIERREPDRVLPPKARLLAILTQAFPRLGERVLIRFTGGNARTDEA